MYSRSMALDRITVSVIQHRLESIVQEMGEAMLRTAYSQILNSSRDFSTAVFDGEGRLAAQAEHVPIHVGALPWAVKAVAEYFAGRIRPGDMYLLNDPYHGGNHLPDLTVLLPVFVGERLAFWSINRAHQSDIGGATHGAYNPGATEIWQEGIRIPPLKLYDAGELRDDVMQMVATNVRHPQDFLGDLRAMLGSARVGERRLLKLVDDYGIETATAAVGEVLDSAERQSRACIRGWKDGVYRGLSILDDDGHGIEDIKLRATVTKKGDSLIVDLTQCDPQVIGFVNSSYPNTISAVHMALAYLLDPRIPKNEGTFRPVEIKAKQGTIVWPYPPAPVTLATNHCAQEIAEAVIKALAGACPDRALAGWSRRFRIAISGKNPRTHRPFIWHLFHARGGGGASSAGDGWETAGEGQAAGGIKFGSVEVATSSAPTPSATGSSAAVWDPCSASGWKRPSSPRATRPATACVIPPTAYSAARTDCPTATSWWPAASGASSRPRRSVFPSRPAPSSTSSPRAAAAGASRRSARRRPAPPTSRTAS